MKKITKAILLDDKNKIDKYVNYDVIYYGNEFCQNLIPTYEELKYLKSKIGIKQLVFVTTFVTNDGLIKIEKILRNNEKFKIFDEVIVNDFGVMELLNKKFPDIRISLGRIFAQRIFKIKLNTIISNDSNFNIFKSYNIEAYGLTSIGSNMILPKKILLDIYYPYFPLSITRRCLVGFSDNNIKDFNKCNHSCNERLIIAKNPVIKNNLYIKGNTYYIKHDGIPKNINLVRCRRLIYQPLDYDK